MAVAIGLELHADQLKGKLEMQATFFEPRPHVTVSQNSKPDPSAERFAGERKTKVTWLKAPHKEAS